MHAYLHFLGNGQYERRDPSCRVPTLATRELSLIGRPPAFAEDASFIAELNDKVKGRTFRAFSGDFRKRNSLLTEDESPE